MELAGKVVVVTGGARGLGKAYCMAFLEKGAKVAILDVLEEEGERSATEMAEKFGQGSVIFQKCDVAEKESVTDAFAAVKNALGYPDVLINNAGVLLVDDWLTMMNINLLGLMRCTYEILEGMKKDNGGKGGVIVNISSIAAYMIGPYNVGYHASKNAVLGFSRALGSKVQHQSPDSGIRVLTICPSFVRSAMTLGFQDKYDKGEDKEFTDLLNDLGGWVSYERIVETMISAVEDDRHPNESVFEVMGDKTSYKFPESLAGKEAIFHNDNNQQ